AAHAHLLPQPRHGAELGTALSGARRCVRARSRSRISDRGARAGRVRYPGRVFKPARDARATLRSELAASIDRTLQDEARRNEQAIASVRVSTLLATAGVEIWLLSGPSQLGDAAPWLAALTFGYLAVAVGLWQALRRGFWTPAIGLLAPV